MATQVQKQPYMAVNEGLRNSFHALFEKGIADGTLRSEVSEEAMLSGTFHIMLAAVTRYAEGLVYVPENGPNPERELTMLKRALLREYALGI